MSKPISDSARTRIVKQFVEGAEKTPRCARCNEKIEVGVWITKVNGVPIGPHCVKRYQFRVKLRQKGEGGIQVEACKECGYEYMFRSETTGICPENSCCCHCPYAHIEDHGDYCRLERQRGLAHSNRTKG